MQSSLEPKIKCAIPKDRALRTQIALPENKEALAAPNVFLQPQEAVGNVSPLCVFLPANELWRQVLIYPAVEENGQIKLLQEACGAIVWVEQNSGQVWCLGISDVNKFDDRVWVWDCDEQFWGCYQRFPESIQHEYEQFWDGHEQLKPITQHELELLAKCFDSTTPNSFQDFLSYALQLNKRKVISLHDDSLVVKIANALVSSQKTLHNLVPGSLLEQEEISVATIIKWFRQGEKYFSNKLDKEALTVLETGSLKNRSDAEAYNYYTHRNPEVRQRRCQAAQFVPCLAGVLHTASDSAHRNIDKGNLTIDVLAKGFAVPNRVIRFLANKDISLIGGEWRGAGNRLLHLLRSLNADRYPQTKNDWAIFTHFFIRRTFLTTQDKWLLQFVQPGYAAIPKRMEKNRITLVDIEMVPDFLGVLYDWFAVVKPGLVNRLIDNALYQHGIYRLAALSRRWHDVVAGLSIKGDKSPCEGVQLSWPTIIEKSWAYNKHIVVPLGDVDLLKAEGVEMEHCIGTYARNCIMEGAHCFSIREAESGKPLSTAELAMEKDGGIWKPVIRQHQGKRNQKPSNECQNTLNQFIAFLNTKVPQERYEEIDKAMLSRQLLWDKYLELIQKSDWPVWRVNEFRRLLQGYKLLQDLEYNDLAVD